MRKMFRCLEKGDPIFFIHDDDLYSYLVDEVAIGTSAIMNYDDDLCRYDLNVNSGMHIKMSNPTFSFTVPQDQLESSYFPLNEAYLYFDEAKEVLLSQLKGRLDYLKDEKEKLNLKIEELNSKIISVESMEN